MLRIGNCLTLSLKPLRDKKLILCLPVVVMLLLHLCINIIFGELHQWLLDIIKANTVSATIPAFDMAVKLLALLITCIILAPLLSGTLTSAAQITNNKKVTITTPFSFKKYWLQTAAALVLIITLNTIAEIMLSKLLIHIHLASNHIILFWLMVIVSNMINLLIYSFLLFSLIIIIEHNNKAIEALITSAKIVSAHWLRVLLLFLIIFFLLTLSLIPIQYALYQHKLLIGIIGTMITTALLTWTLPYCLLILGNTYNTLINK